MIGNDLVWVGGCDSKGHRINECGCGEKDVPPSIEELFALAESHPEDLIITCKPSSGIFYTTLSEGKNYCLCFVILSRN